MGGRAERSIGIVTGSEGTMFPGIATAQGTAEYFNSRKVLGGWLEATGLHCSTIGFGSYRVDDETPLYAEALKTALLNGCNLIDTSTNYADGRSERMIGAALGEMMKVRAVDRDQVIVVSKVGYVQGQALELAQAREAEGRPFPEMVKYANGCWHCIHPEFLEVQFEKSRQRLGLESLDFYLLHNPEYFLMDAAKRGSSQMLPKLRDTFYERIQRAFAYLESLVAEGKLQGYGVSSNTFGAPATRADATSVSRMFETARAVSDKHHFQIVQLPMNLFESGPALEKNTGEGNGQTALEFAIKQHLGVLVNRPLNAFTRDSLVRLADFDKTPAAPLEPLLKELAVLEMKFLNEIAPDLSIKGGADPTQLFRWSDDLREVQNVPLGIDRWTQVEDQVGVHVSELCRQISAQLKTGPWQPWQEKYLPKLRETLTSFRRAAQARTQKNSDEVSATLDPLLPESWRNQPLSRKALGVLLHTRGVSSVLNGIRRADYVYDSLAATKLPPLDEKTVSAIYEAFRAKA